MGDVDACNGAENYHRTGQNRTDEHNHKPCFISF